MAEPLTKRQKEVLDFVSQFIELHGYAPSYREIATYFKYGSVATVAEHIESLVGKGMLSKSDNEARSIQLVKTDVDATPSISLPILGLVAAGQPIETLGMHPETLEVPPFMVGRKNSYVLQVKGDSMIDEGIHTGDYVVVTEKPVPSKRRDGHCPHQRWRGHPQAVLQREDAHPPPALQCRHGPHNHRARNAHRNSGRCHRSHP